MHTQRILTLITDFGDKSGYVGVMKGVILSINPDCQIVDISHQISPQDREEAAFVPYANYGSEVGRCTYFDQYCPIVALSGQNIQFETKIVKSNNYQLIWSSLSNTELISYPEDMTKYFITVLVGELNRKKLI